jgi:transcriptional antiterminator Rof (Rho-off)
MPQSYKPLSCSAYDVLESSAVRKHDIELCLSNGSSLRGTIKDIFSKGSEEFCTVEPRENVSSGPVRLDEITLIIDHTEQKEYSTITC